MVSALPDDLNPSLNRFAQQGVAKGEPQPPTYADCIGALANASTTSEKAAKEGGLDRVLSRLTQYGYIRVASVEPLLKALRSSADAKEGNPLYARLLFYLTQLALGDGSAGTPLPMPASRGNLSLPKAVDVFGPDVLSAAWADLSEEKSSFLRKQGALRVLAALAHASLTSKPDDPTYPAGVLITLQSLLASIEQVQAQRKSLTGILAATAAAKKKNNLADIKKQLETAALLRLAFSSARIALSKSGLMQIAPSCFQGVCSTDAICARHSLALAAFAAREPGGAAAYASNIGPSLQRNVETSKRTGLLHQAVIPGGKTKAGAPPPTVMREDTSMHLNLKDTFARVYLARGCAATIQGGAGDITGSGAPFWEALLVLACSDGSDVVAFEAMRAMFGAPAPQREPLRRRPGALGEPELAEMSLQGRIYAGCWQMVQSAADTAPGVPHEALLPPHELLDITGLEVSNGNANGEASGTTLFTCIINRLLYGLTARSASAVTAAAKTAGVILEARAWFASMSGATVLETEVSKKCIRLLHNALQAVFSAESRCALERCAAGEALLWLQLATPEEQDCRTATVQPLALLRAASQGGLAVQPVVHAEFADPWPEALCVSYLTALHRRQRCNPALSNWCFQLAAALAAASPSKVPKDLLLSLWDAAPGPTAVRAACELLASPPPPVTQPIADCNVEVRVLAAAEDQAYEGLRAAAAWWLGEHANGLAGIQAWKPVPKAAVLLDFLEAAEQQEVAGSAAGGVASDAAHLEAGERLMLAASMHAPLLTVAVSHLNRHALTGTWEVRVACIQGLAKIAVRSPEPFRIQTYAALRALARGATVISDGSPAPLQSWQDPLGLGPVLLPVLEVLDAIYAGHQVLASSCNMHGMDPKKWPAGALASVKRRHEWLLGAIAHRIGAMPKDVFYPLGRLSKRLLNPDAADEDKEEVDEDEAALDKAAAAADQLAEDADYGEYEDDYYGDQYYDDGGSPHAMYHEGADPLAKWQAGDESNNVANVTWRGLTEASSTKYDNAYTPDEDDIRYGTVIYDFHGETEDEVSVQTGERVRLHVDMGDWVHITNAAGQQGMVPASYVQVEESYQAAESASATPRAAQYGGYGGDKYEVYGDNGYRAYGGYDGGAYGQEQQKEEEKPKKGGGLGFDDFGSMLREAADAARKAAQERAEAMRKAMEARQSRLESVNSVSSTGSARQTQTPKASDGGPGPSSFGQTQPTISETGPIPSYGQDTYSAPAVDYSQSQYSSYAAPQEPTDTYAAPNAYAPVDTTTAYAAAGVEDAYAPTGGAFAIGQRVKMAYSFAAEQADELNAEEGEEVEVLRDDGDWLLVGRPDGTQGLVPSNYVTA